MEVWPNEIMFILQYFENYKCWWDSKPNITAVDTDPENSFSDSCQQIVINFFVVVQACFWTCSPLALWASSAVTGTLCSTNPSSLLQCCLQNAVPISLRSFLHPIFASKLENTSFLTALRRHLDQQRWVSFVLLACFIVIWLATDYVRVTVLRWQLKRCLWAKLISSSNSILIQVQSESLGKLHISDGFCCWKHWGSWKTQGRSGLFTRFSWKRQFI